MKYLKSFEDNDLKYKVGDWVKIKIIPDFVYDIGKIDDNLFVKIEDMEKYIVSGEIEYCVTFRTLLTNQKLYGNQYFILRKMTKEEIKEFKIKIEAKKYNI